MRAPFYWIWAEHIKGSRDFAQILNGAAVDCPNLSVQGLIESYGREGEAYQDAFDACFCEEIFLPLVPELEGEWIRVTNQTVFETGKFYDVTWASDKPPFKKARYNTGAYVSGTIFTTSNGRELGSAGYRPTYYREVAQNPEPYIPPGWILFATQKPYDGATCDFCDSFDGPTCAGSEIQTAEYQEWISHPGGEATANAGPGFVDEHGFPAYEDPIWWRYHEEPLEAVQYYAKVVGIDEAPKWSGSIGEISPEPWVPPSSTPTPSEGDDYYATI